MCASEIIVRRFLEISEFSSEYILAEHESITAGSYIDLESHYKTIFNSVDEDLIVSAAFWIEASLPTSGGKEDFMNEDWASAIGKVYSEIKRGKADCPEFILKNENLIHEILRNAEMDTELTSALYQIQRGITRLNDHDMHMIDLRHQISIMGLGREPRVPTLNNYCDLISLVAYHNQTETIKRLLLTPLRSAEKQIFLDWAIRTDALSYIDEAYSGAEFISIDT